MRLIARLLFILLFSLLYLRACHYGSHGYGFMGYYGNDRGPSIFAFSDYQTYQSRNIRTGSGSGARSLGRGPGSGK